MPRSNNAVASRTRRKKVLKMAKGYYGARKNVWTVAKNAVEKGLLSTPIQVVSSVSVNSALCGSCESMLELVSTACRIAH